MLKHEEEMLVDNLKLEQLPIFEISDLLMKIPDLRLSDDIVQEVFEYREE